MSFSGITPANAGAVRVFATNGGNHKPETWAEMTANRIIEVADTAIPPIRDQAHAFRESIVDLLRRNFAAALGAERSALADALEAEGMKAAAAFVRHRGG